MRRLMLQSHTEEIRDTQGNAYSLRLRHKEFAQICIQMRGVGQSGQKEGSCGRVESRECLSGVYIAEVVLKANNHRKKAVWNGWIPLPLLY